MCGVILLFSGSRAVDYLSTKYGGGDVSQTDKEIILASLQNRWNLVVMDGATDLPKIIANDRIARIEFRQSTILHSNEDPQQGQVIRVWASSLTGSIKRRSFVFLPEPTVNHDKWNSALPHTRQLD